ncbi:DsbA family protein [Natronomonas marina]|uniref:DsbA family protein n=1 Tax=Natronomonas marina TaxID=2961939 RepID=UPI0020C97C9E|nr:thioredoxin domain-containing protein [Natronomonas marina]
MDHSRRSLLACTAGAAATAVAGCLGGDDTQSFDAHPATTGVESQPTLGSLDATAAIVAFEDPSCSSCRRFETETFPSIESELVEPGDAAFVYRTLDITYPWSEPASQVMASTYDADTDAFWGLKDYYYERQPEFDSDNVFELSESYLEGVSSVDAASVVEAARDGEHDALIQRNRNAAEAAGVGSTPQFFLFRDDEFRTQVSGPQDFEVFASALGFEP